MFEEFLRSHYEETYRYLFGQCRKWHRGDTHALVEDLNQQLWEKVCKYYEKVEKAEEPRAYLYKMAKNLVSRQTNSPESTEIDDSMLGSHEPDSMDLEEKIAYLHMRLIPRLSCKQRMAYLLYHESELWEGERRLSWEQLAQLNGLEPDEVARRFERARAVLLRVYHHEKGWEDVDLDCEDILLFLVWTQAQRYAKAGKFTWEYFARLLAVKPNVLVIRYRDAIKNLDKGMVKRFGENWDASFA